MNRRDFMTVLGGAGVASLAGFHPAFAAEQTTTLYLKGLVMVSFENQMMRIGFPKAPGHKATLRIQPVNGAARKISLNGNGSLQLNTTTAGAPKIVIPEIVKTSEFYGPNVKAKFDKCPSLIEIPYSAIRSIATSAVTKDRWTFVRADNGQEVNTFRPRQIAEGLKVEISSNGVLKLNGGKMSVPLQTTQEILANYEPEANNRYPDMYVDHFAHYFEYMDRPPAADFMVVPKRITGISSSTTPRVGNNFAMIDFTPMCYLILIGELLTLG
jgi:hypothetical protein